MKQKLIGVVILGVLLSVLLGFPFLANILPQNSTKIEITKSSASPFFLKTQTASTALVYFGYVGCTEICAPALEDLAYHYNRSMKANTNGVAIYFVSLNPDIPNHQPDIFAKAFHSEFHGVYATAAQIEELSKLYNIAIGDKDTASGHSSHLYLFVKTSNGYTLKNIFPTHPFPGEEIFTDIKKRLQ